MKRRNFLKIGAGVVGSGALGACGGGGGDAGAPPELLAPPVQTRAVVGWNQVALQAVRTTRLGPPMVARSLAVLHCAMYDAWAAYDRLALQTPRGTAQRRPAAEHTAANKTMAMSCAAHAALVDQFPSQKAAFDSYLATLGLGPDSSGAQDVGTVAAAAVLEACHRDGSNQLGKLTASGVPYADYTSYAPVNPPLLVAEPAEAGSIAAPGHWQPLSYVNASGAMSTPGFLAACWPEVKPFAMASASQFRPSAPAALGSPEFAAQAQRIIDVQLGLTERQKVISEYWSDGPASETPPGHWCLFAQFVSARDRHSDDEDVKMFFALANAMFDASIAAWDAKREYDSARPITAIRYLMSGKSMIGYGPQGPAGGLRPIAGEAWMPYQPPTFPTPPFPEHVSGHSTFSAAAAEALRQFTGSDVFGAAYIKAAHSLLVEPGLPKQEVTLNWPTFTAAAAEAGESRIYGGIHFDNANLDGLELGRKVGARAFSQARAYWLGLG